MGLLAAVGSNSLEIANRAILLAASPIQALVERPGLTHSFCNRQAIRILLSDGRERAAQLAAQHLENLEAGSIWVDRGWRSSGHFYDPDSGRGLWRWPSALDFCRVYYGRAVANWKKGAAARAFFYLGAATHLVQDLCVPHHSAGKLFDGHQEFEDLARERALWHPCRSGGLYDLASEPGSWVAANANFSQGFLPLARAGAPDADKEEAISNLLPRAQRSTAGFLAFFAEEVADVRKFAIGQWCSGMPELREVVGG